MTGYKSKKAAAQAKLAQPAQEPVCPECKAEVLYECVACSSNNYPQKSAQEPVAVHQFRSPHCSDWYDGIPDQHDGHGPYEVRTLYTTAPAAQPAQEPVAWMRPSEEGYDSAFRDHRTVLICTGNPWTGWIPLYTTPTQRPWVGLMDEQIADYLGDKYHAMTESELRFFRLGEAAAKEKNNG